MGNMACHIKRLAIVPALAVAMMAGGCGPGVHIEGPGFEKLGLTGKKHVEQNVPDRAPLLIPPDRSRLPEPALSVVNARPQSWPTDPESTIKAEATAAIKKQRVYEDKGDWSKKADIDEFEKLMDPMERAQGVFSNKALGDKNRDFKKYER
jgi:hypothetical protein